MNYVVTLRIPAKHEETVMEFHDYDDAKKYYDDVRYRFIDSALNTAIVTISQVLFFSVRK